MPGSISLLRRNLIARALVLPPAEFDVSVEHNLSVPMWDGVVLRADHYAPKTYEALPAVLIRSPWGRGWQAAPFSLLYMFVAQRFAERGYHVILQDTRDTSGDGDGGWLAHEERDGRATLDWIGKQAWFNGSLGMWGASIVGYTAWAAAVNAPPFVKALVPVTTASSWYNMIYPDGAFALDTMLRLAAMVNAKGKSFRDLLGAGKAQAQALAAALEHLPVGESDAVLLGKPDRAYRNWFKQDNPEDPYWQDSDHSLGVPHITAAVHLVAGWYDIFLREQLADYNALQTAGRSPYLTIGPWHHTSTDLGIESVRLALAWFDAQLKRNITAARSQPVRVAVLGAPGVTWREFSAWPPPPRETRHFLHSEGRLLEHPAPPDSQPDHYHYDPADPTPSVGGPGLNPKAVGQRDNRLLEARADVLTYTTPTLEQDVEIIGTARLHVFVDCSNCYADLFGRVCDVHPDGRSLNVCDGLMRVEPDLHEPLEDGPLCVQIAMHPIAYRFRKGHRIRLQISSGAHPRWSRNLGTGDPLATATRLVATDQTIYHDDQHPSALILPVC